MGSDGLAPLLALLLPMLGGGIIGSFGLNAWWRSRWGNGLIRRMRWWGVAGYYVLILGGAVTGGVLIVARVMSAFREQSNLDSPWLFLSMGLVAGVPFTLPVVTMSWLAARREARPAEKTKPPTRTERVQYAKELERQFADVVERGQSITAKLGGDKGTILILEGDITRQQAERLAAALRADLLAAGFTRLEGRGPKAKWWVPVSKARQ